MKRLTLVKMAGLAVLFSIATAVASPAQTLTTLASFNYADGANPLSPALVQGIDGNFYGTTGYGGTYTYGTAFSVTPQGALTSIYNFGGETGGGIRPIWGLFQATNGDLYGTTVQGGTNHYCAGAGCGTIYKLTAQGALTTLYNFCDQLGLGCTDGYFPIGGLIQASDGLVYGVTNYGGAYNANCIGSCGTIFKITPQGGLTTLFRFDGANGAFPFSGLLQGTDGSFYGITAKGGPHNTNCGAGGCGTVFEMSPSGSLTTIYNFCSQPSCADGELPEASLIQGTDGNFYGTTLDGGAVNSSECYGCGTVFKITPAGALTTLHSFVWTDGAFPLAQLVQATDGNFYGTTANGASTNCETGCGTVFKITPEGRVHHDLYILPSGLSVRGRIRPSRGADTSHRRESLRDNGVWWSRVLWHSV